MKVDTIVKSGFVVGCGCGAKGTHQKPGSNSF